MASSELIRIGGISLAVAATCAFAHINFSPELVPGRNLTHTSYGLLALVIAGLFIAAHEPRSPARAQF